MEKVNGVVTPEMQHEYLKRWAHLEGEKIEPSGVSVKYFTVNDGVPIPKQLLDAGFKVICYNGKAVQVNRITKDEAKTMASCLKLSFGGF